MQAGLIHEKAMRGLIALNSTSCEKHYDLFGFAKLWECARVLAALSKRSRTARV